MKSIWAPALAAAAALTLALSTAADPDPFAGPAAIGQSPAFPGQTRAASPSAQTSYRVETVAEGLDHPWSLAWLPDGEMLVTERPGRLRLVSPDGALSRPVSGVPAVRAQDTGGLLDVVLDPAFAENQLVYLTYLEPRDGGSGIAVARARLSDAEGTPSLEALTVIFRATPALDNALNVGSRLTFGPDGYLYVTLGDRMTASEQAQDLTSDLGKIVRIAPDGSIPPDNPFTSAWGARPEIFTLGHRNPEGLAFDPARGVLWEHENGPKGGDKVNVIRPGANYGWPQISYGADYSGEAIGIGTQKPGMAQPVYYWDPSIAPSGLAVYTGDLFPAWKGDLLVGALKGRRLVRLHIQDGRVAEEEVLLNELKERIRDVRQGPDGAVYVLTDNSAGRILRLTPSADQSIREIAHDLPAHARRDRRLLARRKREGVVPARPAV
ncbi:MAG TPA: PQQ-dependent sugar dehydrogenase [Caulobacteraceae bacterium]|jgi:glucose/arabinose dehydrogenase